MKSERMWVVAALAIVALFSGCGSRTSEQEDSDEKLHVAVSILPQAYFVDRISGGNAAVTVLIPPGSSPHTYDPSPRQMTELATTDVLFVAGVPFEEALLPRLHSVNPHMRVIPSGDGIPVRRSEESGIDGHDGDHDHHTDNDPHTWLSPRNAIVHARAIARELESLDSGHAETYRRNLDSLVRDIEALDAEIRQMLHGTAGRKMYVFHPAWGYFTDEYGLIQVPIQSEGKEPGSRQLAELTEHAAADSVRAIFVQMQYASQSPHVIADAIGARIVLVDPLAYDYVENLRSVAREVIEALGVSQATR
ncbi:MAG: zinc ABC transporter substrate-binding protein [candidate division Zixibacteria bacterium]|jgi:zinc transport system substrate-binding protein|nr:zinc ABC transporter substrate-binding protein [candidate division Zixibacteria bacterium]